MDALSIVVDEVALEGLDGITIPSLWIRLQDRKPEFPLKLDDYTKGFIWRSLASNVDLSFYQLPVEREDVELFDRYKEIDLDMGCEAVQTLTCDRKDVYSVHIVPENKHGIQGSCLYFKERKNVTKQVRSQSLTPLVDIQEALEKYGRTLVVVASQSLRFRTLIGSENDPELKLSNESYCVLERVGRGRWQGEIQSDLHGGLFKADGRRMHYLRKSLVKHELITMQSYVRRLKTGYQQHSILLLLKRFHFNRRNKYDILMEQVSNFLLQFPDQFTTVHNLKEHINLNDNSLKRAFRTFKEAKLVQFINYPLEDLDPTAGPCTNKNGSKVLVRCVKLLKPYKTRELDDDDDDDDDDDNTEGGGRDLLSEGRVMERDLLSQAYHMILSAGTKGISQRSLRLKMNVGRLESRIICRKLHRDGMIKSFMEDEGRQRTSKYISHRCTSNNDQLQLFAKEQERNKLLYSSATHTLDPEPASPKTPPTSKGPGNKSGKTVAAKKGKRADSRRNRDAEEGQQVANDPTGDVEDEKLEGNADEANDKCGTKRTAEEDDVKAQQTEPDLSIAQSTEAERESPACSGSINAPTPASVSVPTAEVPVEEEKQSNSTPASSLSQTEAVHSSDNPANTKIVEVDNLFQSQRSHETYRLLKRKNLIVEAIRNFKIIEGPFPLQKIINEAEKQDGVSSKCCKKTVLRLVHSLSKQGLLKLYTTTVIQDGITKKVDIITHPSIQPSDQRIIHLIEQVRFKISSSYAAGRLQIAGENSGNRLNSGDPATSEGQRSKSSQKRFSEEDANFKPTTVPGLGKTFGYQPKMIRMRAIHSFLWYLIYGHPLREIPPEPVSANQTPAEPVGSDPDAKLPESQAKQDEGENKTSNLSLIDEGSGDEDGPQSDPSDFKVYADEDSWRRFVPPIPVHKGFTSGWAMVRNLVLCLPLSIFVQIIQINYKVDDLEDYLSDPVKQHYLVRLLPPRMKRQLLYKRKYIYNFYENLQKLTYMGLLQFGVVERFKDKDQVFIYLKRNASIVDTTSSEPHYWLVQEPPDKPFERRHYTFNTAEDVESFWFDLMCVCLNTPLGVIRNKRSGTVDESTSPFVHKHTVIVGMGYLLKGSYEVCDDGSIPGDGRGAGGLDSELFSHLKRNWFWTSHLLISKRPSSQKAPDAKLRLKSLLSKTSLRMALEAGNSLRPAYLTNKQLVIPENIEMGIEPASRNDEVVGGKGQKRKRKKKEVVKAPRNKKKEPRKRSQAHDAKDHQALKRMTRRRVYWSVQEDSVLMLCSVALHLLNSKLIRPFVPHCVVRDLLHAEFEKSKDKTSLSVGRRSSVILRNRQTLLNHRICLAEVHQDKELMSLLEEKKPANPDQAEDCAKAFSEYVRLLRQKFSTVMCVGDLVIPDAQEQIFTRFKVSAIDDGKHVPSKDSISCKDDIHAIVLHNLIQSSLAMTNGQMKTARSFQTFRTYTKYNQELLCRVFIQSRKRRLFNRRRITQSLEPKKNRGLPILPMSFQLSQTYYRIFSWRFPHSLCTDSFSFLRTLITNGSGDDRPATTFYHEPEIRSLTGKEACDGKPARKGKHGCGSETLEEMAGAEAADAADDNQSTVQGEEKSVEIENAAEKIAPDKEEKLERSGQSGAEDGSSSREQTDVGLPEEPAEAAAAPDTAAGDPTEDPDPSDMLPFSLSSPGGACVVSLSLMTVGLLSVHLSIPKQIVVVDSSLVDNDVVKSMATLEEDDEEEDDDEGDEGRKKLQVTAHQASHTNYLLMRGYCSPGIVKLRNLNPNDSIVVESCIMKLRLRDTPAHHCFTDQNTPPFDLTKYGPSLLPPILTRNVLSPSSSPPSVEECNRRFIQDRGYTAQDIEACAELRRSLDEAEEKGLDERDLHISHIHLQEPRSGRTRSLQQYLKDLQEEGQVVRVGGFGVRWVLMEHAEPWLLTVNCKQASRSQLRTNKGPLLRSLHNLPFAVKRCSRVLQQVAEEPPEKKPAVDEEKETDGGAVDGSSAAGTEDQDEAEQQKEPAGDEGGDNLPGLEEEGQVQTQPDEEGEQHDGQEKIETEQGSSRPKRTRKCRLPGDKDEVCALPSGSDETEENLSFISRPWRFIDGKVNRPVCKGILEAVLYHIMSRPGLTQQALLVHYKDILQPVAVLDIVQALIDLGCVTKRTLVKDPKPSLFSRPAATNRETAAVTEEPDAVFYEPTVSCCLRLCRLLPNERHWNDSFT
ncbi:general transcription factor 3C polypeptide 1 [Fundulus heteroclitus]|uniref:general transcription factor 3C polypeptide 1 n=1 Tax=Fundulus heteroclitus TaxID=8078 RepID=UPI00165BB11A|nr:general transcription factor 3C polypeptide 1 [Fundulus heteroclitus]